MIFSVASVPFFWRSNSFCHAPGGAEADFAAAGRLGWAFRAGALLAVAVSPAASVALPAASMRRIGGGRSGVEQCGS